MMQGGAQSLAVFLQTAPPPLYLVYMLAAGFGLPVNTFPESLNLNHRLAMQGSRDQTLSKVMTVHLYLPVQ